MITFTCLAVLALWGWQFEANRRHRNRQRQVLTQMQRELTAAIARVDNRGRVVDLRGRR